MRVTFLAIGFLALVASLPVSAETIDISDAPPYPALYEPDSLGGEPDFVLMGADLVEIAVALGGADRILARPDSIELPGIDGTPNKVREWAGVEGVLAMRPEVTIGSSAPNVRLIEGLRALGQRAEIIDRTLPPADKVRRMAEILGAPERGEALVQAIQADYAQASELKRPGHPLRLVHASRMGAGTSFTAGGSATAVDNLIARVGALNAAAAVGRDRYRPVTPEGVLQMAPDVLLIAESELASFGGIDGMWSSYPGLALTPAGQRRNVIVMRDLHVRSDAASSGIATVALAKALSEIAP
ncbi:ABC transporter substrate-binding protein [Aureimonas frigidaquae]|uniref:ABC transporter substrate-binding protein n=1 Tax=Aureimonas frigidaquae TaxID=424757 RepID=A0A0P0Z0I6_9HYPH|nr:ABC transporter substrate-binding protein [Aureimonas frigidaquae]BAT27412.1 ABC transporter substrate-binding protein [Aureimonas frigidaquae]